MVDKFKLDENLPLEAAELLNKSGYDARTVYEEKLAGATDSQIAKMCQDEKRVLITFDIDFSEIAIYPPKMYPGIVGLRVKRQDKSQVLKLINSSLFR